MMAVDANGTGGYWGTPLHRMVNQALTEGEKSLVDAQAELARKKTTGDTAATPQKSLANPSAAAATSNPQQVLMDLLARSLQGQSLLQGASPTTSASPAGNNAPSSEWTQQFQQVVFQLGLLMLMLQAPQLLNGRPPLPPPSPQNDLPRPPAPAPTPAPTPAPAPSVAPAPAPSGNPLPPLADLPGVPAGRRDEYADLVLAEALRAQTGEANPDQDNAAVSQDDLDWIKKLITDKKLTPDEVSRALARQLDQGDIKQSDETAVLIGQAIDQGVLPVDAFLNPTFLQKLDTARMQALSTSLANVGIQGKDGKPLTNWIGWLLVNGGNDQTPTGKLASQVLDKLPDTWADYWQTPEGQQVRSFLENFAGVKLPAQTTTVAKADATLTQ